MRKFLLAALAALAFPAAGLAQSLPILDQNPPSLRWQQVNTPHFRVLYPTGFEAAAQRTAQRLEQVHGPGAATLGVKPRPIAVVLQTRTSVSNGFVTFLPRHAEFFATPEQGMSLGTNDWLDQLVVHEYRHIGQFEKGRQGIGRLLGPLLGDGALGVSAVGLPQWFFEGDAVGTETALTRSGRGSIPEFGVGMRANRLAGAHYNYQKAANGSLRDNVPNWYVLGYYLTSYAKTRYGADVWDRVLTRYNRFPFYPFSFSNSLRRTTGLRVEQLYARTMANLDSTWQDEQRKLKPTEARELAGQYRGRVFTQYQYPQYVNDSTIVALKTGLGDIAQLVLLSTKTGKERKLHVLGPLNLPEMLSVGGGKVVWPEYRYDARWGQRVYSELKVLDLATGQVARLGRRHRYTAASLSPNGTRLVAVETDSSYHHALSVLDARTGAVLETLPNPQNDFYQQPHWTPDGQRIVTVTLKPAGKTMELLDPAAGTTRALLPVANVNVSNPQPWGEYVLYNSPQSGIDNVYAVHTGTSQTYQVASRQLGAYHAAPSPAGNYLAFHDYRATGARIVEMPLNPATWQQTTTVTNAMPGPYVNALTAREPGAARMVALLAGTAPDTARVYPTRPYSVLRNAFNVFGWGVVQNPSGNNVSLGVRSQDVLSTTQAIAGVTYDQTERTGAVFGGVSYQGQYPVLDADISYGGRNLARYVDRRRPLDSLQRDQWRYTRLTAGVRLPLTLTRSKYLEALTLSSYYLHERVSDYDLPVRSRSEPGPNQPVHAIQNTLSYVRQLRLSARDVAPRWGGSLLLTSRSTPFGAGLDAWQLAGQGSVYLPGVGKHHALRLRAGYQQQQQRQYQFAAAVSFPRGEGYVSFDRLRAASLDYYLPLAYPHWSVGRWLYVQRIRATGFADVAQGQSSGLATRNYRNVGLDTSVLFNVLRLRTPLEAGARVVLNTYTQELIFEPLAFSIRL
ncbi:hypothetical protein MTX78_20720 [Hymenobacter tibetensis]|uniref:Biopolymer transporter Tol n=1 Tax=Hymenobacter tibetensis TaxID=497967 RepID=A0ABY4CYE5_9BACT|nr:hypothetical protein [Hymenobacter tibetensis]UOG74529.1 hypothetical protein MTX78_20720 [Hymenobacter tibetensis]